MKIITVLGTRPEIIRLSIIIELLDKYTKHIVVHTGQNYDFNLRDIFFEQLRIRNVDICFDSKSDTFSEQIGKILSKCEEIFKEEKPDKVLILGDTNSALSAFVAKRLGIPVYHLEAGNRCYDNKVPEEVNRIVIDHCSTIHMPYTYRSKENLLREGIGHNNIYVVGNPIYEVLKRYIKEDLSDMFLKKYHLTKNEYFLLTLHRKENVDNRDILYSIINSLKNLYLIYKIPIFFPIHPRTKSKIEEFKLPLFEGIILNTPLPFFDFIYLELNALCVLTDSGTVQEECCIYRKQCITLRSSTERPETVECGSNIIAGYDSENILKSVEVALNNRNKWNPPEEYLRENVSQTVLNILLSN